MFKIGNSLILEPQALESKEKYKCKLVEQDKNYIYIDYPINIQTGKSIFLLDGTKLKASFLGNDNCVYVFKTEVLGRVKHGIPMLILQFDGNESLIRIQRRQFVRIEAAVDVAISFENDKFPPFVTVTHDISAGGAAIAISNGVNLSSGSFIEGLFVLPMQSGQWNYERIRCKVIRTIFDKHGDRNIVSLEFIEITENLRQVITRFCFEKQLQMKKNKQPIE
jgi:c-di-GMP-binding flagellar brake protein YcgR